MKKTTKGRIVAALRQLWLRSKERSECLKRDKYTCQDCGVKQSRARGKEVKVEVNHKKGITNWDEIVDLIRHELLCEPEDLEVLCVDCHRAKTY